MIITSIPIIILLDFDDHSILIPTLDFDDHSILIPTLDFDDHSILIPTIPSTLIGSRGKLGFFLQAAGMLNSTYEPEAKQESEAPADDPENGYATQQRGCGQSPQQR